MIKHTELKEVIAGIAKELGWSVMSESSSYVDSVGGVVYFDNYQNESVRIQYYYVAKTDSAVRIEADICTYIGGKATKQTLIDRYLKLKSDVISVYNSIMPRFKYEEEELNEKLNKE